MFLKPEKDGRVYHRRSMYQKQTPTFRAAKCRTCNVLYNAKKGSCPNCRKGDPQIAGLTF